MVNLSAVGVAVILGLIIALMVKMKIARISVVVVCVLFGLTLGMSPIGDGVNHGLSQFGAWLAAQVGRL